MLAIVTDLGGALEVESVIYPWDRYSEIARVTADGGSDFIDLENATVVFT